MTIEGYVKNKKLSITPKALLKAVKELGIPAKDINYVLTTDDVKILEQSRIMYVESVNKEAVNSVTDVITDRLVIIDKYKDTLKDPNLTPEEKEILKGQLDQIIAEKKYLEKTVRTLNGKSKKGIAAYERVTGLDPAIIDNGLEQLAVERYDMKMSRISGANGKLSQEYQKYSNLENRTYLSDFKKKANEARKEAVKARISKLQTKEASLQAKQKKIINKNLERYLKKSEKKYKKQDRLASKESEFVKARTENLNEQKITEQNIAAVEKDINRLKHGNLIDKTKAAFKTLDKVSLNSRLGILKSKQGFLNLKNQMRRGIRRIFHKEEKITKEAVNEPASVNPPIPGRGEPTKYANQQAVDAAANANPSQGNVVAIDSIEASNPQLFTAISSREDALNQMIAIMEKIENGEKITPTEFQNIISNPFIDKDEQKVMIELSKSPAFPGLSQDDKITLEAFKQDKQIMMNIKNKKMAELTEDEIDYLLNHNFDPKLFNIKEEQEQQLKPAM